MDLGGQLQRLHCFDLYPLHHIVVQMIDYTPDGLRSQLYAHYEFRYVFWYIGMNRPFKLQITELCILYSVPIF